MGIGIAKLKLNHQPREPREGCTLPVRLATNLGGTARSAHKTHDHLFLGALLPGIARDDVAEIVAESAHPLTESQVAGSGSR